MKYFRHFGLAAAGLLLAQAASAEVSHIVLFDLTDDSAEAMEAMVAGAHEYLCDIEGVVSCQVGTRQTERTAGNVLQDYDVSLIITLENEDYHKAYDTNARHMEFIGKFRSNWAGTRVIDSNLSDPE